MKVINNKILHGLNTLGPVLGLVGVYFLFVLIAPPSFSTLRNIDLIARHTAVVGTAALGMTRVAARTPRVVAAPRPPLN